MVWKPFRFQHQSRWTPRRNNLRRNKKPGNSGFFIVCRLAFSLISSFRLGSLGCAQAPYLFRVSEQRAINLNTIPRLNQANLRIGNHFAKDPQRAIRQIQLGKRLTDARDEHRSPYCRTFSHTDGTQNLTINGRIYDLYLDHRLNHASVWHAGRTRPPEYSQPD